MISTLSAVVIALLSLLTGLAVGALFWRHWGPQRHRNRDLEHRLAAAEQRLGDYQAEVTEHFVQTARRVNDLTRNYREVHEYLASSAVKLTNPSLGQEMRAAAEIDWSRPTEEADAETGSAPQTEDEAAAGNQHNIASDTDSEDAVSAPTHEDNTRGHENNTRVGRTQ